MSESNQTKNNADTKPDQPANQSNHRLTIVGCIFIGLFIFMIVYEVVMNKPK